jgi:hypothetical protein
MGRMLPALPESHLCSSSHKTDAAAKTDTKGNYLILIYFYTPVGVHGTVRTEGIS